MKPNTRSLAVTEEDYYTIQALAGQWTMNARGRKRYTNAEVVAELVKKAGVDLPAPERPTSLQARSLREMVDSLEPGVEDPTEEFKRTHTDVTTTYSDPEPRGEGASIVEDMVVKAVTAAAEVPRFAIVEGSSFEERAAEEPDLDDWGFEKSEPEPDEEEPIVKASPEDPDAGRWVPGARYGQNFRSRR